jgi:truncated hemoglobin YjbI
MAETATETATNPTEATSATEASDTTLATATEVTGTQQQQGDKPGTQPTTEGDKPVTEEKTATETKLEGAPEKYDFKAPEGKEYDSAVLDSFSEAAKEANLTQEAAQKLLEKVAPSLASRQQEQVEAIRNGWLESAKTDKEFGGEKLQENLGVARKALESFGSPELRKLLDDTGIGNNPEVIRFMFRAGKAISEDSFVSGAPNNKSQANPADVLYPTMKKE